MAVDLILDTDIGTDVDDALALAFALRHPDIDLRAVTTVSGDVTRRAEIARKLLLVAGRDDIEVAPGLAAEPPAGRSPWMGHEGRGLLEENEHLELSRRDGPALLLEECARSPEVAIATVGMQTNIAAALDRDPSLAADRPGCLAVMGGVFAPVRTGRGLEPPSIDHNLNCDPAGALRSLNAGLPTLYVPIDVTVNTTLTHDHVNRLRAGDELCRTLVRLIEIWTPVMAAGGERPPAERAALLHDPLTVACTVDRDLVTVEEMPVTVAFHEGSVRTFLDHVAGHPAEVVTSVDGAAFSELWLETVLASR